MKTYVIPSSPQLIFHSTAPNLVRGLFAAALGAFAFCATAQAVDVIKANNTDNLELTTSWVGGVLPGTNTATWNSTVTSGNTTSTLGTNLSFGGIKIVNPGAVVTVTATVLNSGSVTANYTAGTFTYTGTDVIAGNVVTFGGTTAPAGLTKVRPYFVVNVDTGTKTYQISDTPGGTAISFTNNGSLVTNNVTTALTIGSAGIDLSTATQNLYLAAPVSMSATQTWSVAAGRVLNDTSNTNFGGINVLNNGYSLTVDVAGTGLTNINNFVGTGGLTKNGTGLLTMIGTASSYSGNVVLNDGTLNAGSSATSLGIGASTLTLNGGTLMAKSNAAQNFGRNTTVAGNATFNINNSSTNGGQAYTLGTLSIGANTFTVTHNTLGAAGSLTFGATTLTGNATFDVSTRTDNSLILGAVGESGGAHGFTKDGVGTLTLNGTSTFTGTTTVNVGTLQIGSGGTTGNLSASSAIINNGTLAFNRTNTVTQGTDFTSVIAGTGAVTQSGTGTLVLNGANTFTGGTTISTGTLQFAKTTAMPSSGTVAVGTGGTLAVNAGGTDEFTNSTSGSGSMGGLLDGTGGQGAPVTWTGNVVLGIDTTNANGGSLTYSGIIGNVGTALGIAKLGSNTLTLGATNTYSGNTTISAGTLQFA
ncbi:MAG: autotransporter-associated beta strand repeat-containing protein, partial [bacterium]